MPLRLSGTELMMELMFGEVNSPMPAPTSIICTMTVDNGVAIVKVEKLKRATLERASPDVVNGKCPNLSDSLPLTGPTKRNAISNGMIAIPAASGLMSRMSSKYRLSRRRKAPHDIALINCAIAPPVNSRILRRLMSRSGCGFLLS